MDGKPSFTVYFNTDISDEDLYISDESDVESEGVTGTDVLSETVSEEGPSESVLDPEWEMILKRRKVEKAEMQWKGYRNFLRDLLKELETRRVLKGSIPVLCAFHPIPTTCFDVFLIAGGSPLTLRFQMQDIYFMGFQNKHERWFELEFERLPRHRIPESTMLPLSESYRHIETKAATTRRSLQLGRTQFLNSIHNLSNSNDEGVGPSKVKSILSFIQMIPEAIRFKPIANAFVCRSIHEENHVLYGRLIDIQQDWSQLSENMHECEASGATTLARSINGIKKVEHAINVLGIVMEKPASKEDSVETSSKKKKKDNLPSRGGRKLGDMVAAGALVKHSGARHTKDTSQRGAGSKSKQGGRKHDNIIIANAVFIVDPLSSPVSYIMPLLSLHGEKSSEEIMFVPSSESELKYNESSFGFVEGDLQFYALQYIVYNEAIRATVEISLMNGYKDIFNLYGTICALNSVLGGDSRSFLFSKPRDDFVEVQPGLPISLTKSMVAVPFDSILIVEVKLLDVDSPVNLCGTAEFPVPVQDFGKSENIISGSWGELRVMVIWD